MLLNFGPSAPAFLNPLLKSLYKPSRPFFSWLRIYPACTILTFSPNNIDALTKT